MEMFWIKNRHIKPPKNMKFLYLFLFWDTILTCPNPDQDPIRIRVRIENLSVSGSRSVTLRSSADGSFRWSPAGQILYRDYR